MPVMYEKSAWDTRQPRKDGLRILATRYWPRGLTRDQVDLYLPDLAPSKGLLTDYQSEKIQHPEFRRRYREEMKGQKSLIRTLHWLSESGQILTVMCNCEDSTYCHRRILAGLIEKGV
ncbi:DUF488 family protein [bacterium]|nr:DUF488 family protein [bacterium]